MPAQPFDQQDLDVGDGHRLYVAQYGRTDAPAAIVLHGGPGSGTQPSVLDWFDLANQRVVLFDQRGAGRSQPAGEIAHNDSRRLVDDIERIRERLGIARWLVVGGSWGATLALLYAGRHAAHIRGLVLRGSFLASERELQWFFQSLRALVPAGWARLTAGWTAAQQDAVCRTLCDALLGDDPQLRDDAARRWNDYENAVMQVMAGQPDAPPAPSAELPARVLHKYRIQAHYLAHRCFCGEDEVLQHATALADVPMIIVHGTHDLVCPPENALKLQAANPAARLQLVARGTHTPADPAIAAALKAAAAALAASA